MSGRTGRSQRPVCGLKYCFTTKIFIMNPVMTTFSRYMMTPDHLRSEEQHSKRREQAVKRLEARRQDQARRAASRSLRRVQRADRGSECTHACVDRRFLV